MGARNLGTIRNYFNLGPKRGPLALRVAIDFNDGNNHLSQEFDATQLQIDTIMGTPQAIYIDNTLNAGSLKVTPAGSGMPIYVNSFQWGMYPFNTTGKLRAGFVHTLDGAHVECWIFNTPQVYFTGVLQNV